MCFYTQNNIVNSAFKWLFFKTKLIVKRFLIVINYALLSIINIIIIIIISTIMFIITIIIVNFVYRQKFPFLQQYHTLSNTEPWTDGIIDSDTEAIATFWEGRFNEKYSLHSKRFQSSYCAVKTLASQSKGNIKVV